MHLLKNLFNVWGESIIIHDVSSFVTDLVKHDMEHDNQGCRELHFNPKVIVDLGAHVGIFSIIMSKRYPTAHIYAVEPVPLNGVNLFKNIEENNCKNIKHLCYAVNDGEGNIPLFMHPQNTGSASLFNTHEFGSFLVPTISIDDLLTKIPHDEIDLMKVDIEGCEYQAFKTFTGWNKIKHLSIETHDIPTVSKEINKKIHENFVLFLQSKMPKENLCILTPYAFYKWGKELPAQKGPF